jgi:hypothetical protein
MSWETVAGIVAGVLLAYAVLLFLLWLYARRHPETVTMKDALRLLPDLLRLIRSWPRTALSPSESVSGWCCCWPTCSHPSTWFRTSSR